MARKFSRFVSPHEALKHFEKAIHDVLDDGYTITGINVNEVQIHSVPPESQGVAMSPPEPTSPPPVLSAALAGFDGDISSCCGAPAERKGTCLYCTNCGGSNGCS